MLSPLRLRHPQGFFLSFAPPLSDPIGQSEGFQASQSQSRHAHLWGRKEREEAVREFWAGRARGGSLPGQLPWRRREAARARAPPAAHRNLDGRFRANCGKPAVLRQGRAICSCAMPSFQLRDGVLIGMVPSAADLWLEGLHSKYLLFIFLKKLKTAYMQHSRTTSPISQLWRGRWGLLLLQQGLLLPFFFFFFQIRVGWFPIQNSNPFSFFIASPKQMRHTHTHISK